MKKFLIAGSSLSAVAVAGAAGAVDVTLCGSIDMGIEFGVGKSVAGVALSDAYNNVSLSIAAAGTTDGGMKFGGSFSLGTAAELEFNNYVGDDGNKYLVKMTNAAGTNIAGAAYAVSGGELIDDARIVGVKINSDWNSVGGTVTGVDVPLGSVLDGSGICKIAGRADLDASAMITRAALTAGGDPDTETLADDFSGYLPAGKMAGGNIKLTVNGAGVDGAGAAVTGVIQAKTAGDDFKVGVVGDGVAYAD